MPTTIQTTDILLASGTAYTMSVDEALFVPQGVVVASENGDGIFSVNAGVFAQIDGLVIGGGISRAISFQGGDSVLSIGPTGQVQNIGSGSGQSGVYLNNGGNSLTNAGQITSFNGRTVGLVDGDNVFVNFGSVTSHGSHALATSTSGNPDRVQNHGTLLSLAQGDYAVSIRNDGARIVNSGEIRAAGANAAAVIFGYSGLGTDTARLVNSGVIDGALIGITSFTVTTSGTITIINTGEIAGTEASIQGSNFSGSLLALRNAGTLVGDAVLGVGADSYDGRGGQVIGVIDGHHGADHLRGGGHDDTILGGFGADTVLGGAGEDDISLGDHDDLGMGGIGDDTLLGDAGRDTLMGQGGDDSLLGGTESDELFGGGGRDHLEGESGYDTLYGGLAEDTLSGGAGADLLWGQGGSDSLVGGDSGDTLNGGGLHDTLVGESGYDVLDGGRGDDVLDGGAGNDTLTGGRGDDDLTGGIGEDVFVFGWVNGDDVIHDFQNAIDLIDLSLLDVDLTEVMAAVSAVGASAVMLDLNALGASGTVLIDGVALAGIGGGDFIL